MEAVGKFFLIHLTVSGELDHVLVKNSTAEIHLSRMFTFSYTAAISLRLGFALIQKHRMDIYQDLCPVPNNALRERQLISRFLLPSQQAFASAEHTDPNYAA